MTMLSDGSIAAVGRTNKLDNSNDVLIVRVLGNGAMACK